MTYDKSVTSYLSNEQFLHPTAEYRGAPFWAWNSALDQEELKEQIEIFHQMGFGGFHMHVRQGLETPYLGKEFMDAIRLCTSEAKGRNMFAWLYDEDRWPSGCAGGLVTKEKKYRQKYLLMTRTDKQEIPHRQNGSEESKNGTEAAVLDYFLAAFDIVMNEEGRMLSYRPIAREEEAANKWYFFVCTKPGGEPRFNYQSYIDILSKEAVDRFIEITYESFKEAVGEEFGKTIPAIFTDEPQCIAPILPLSGKSTADAQLVWTLDFSESFKLAYGYEITKHLPELFFAMEGDKGKGTRYRYYRHVMERFAKSYMDNIGKWCGQNHIMMTGHVYGEDSLEETSARVGDAMRMYKHMQLPGIDMLLNDVHLVTAKQCQSVVRQMGKCGMMSELYGVTGWEFDSRGHKFQGDWQACLGVTVRVPHLAWQTMKGESKRDYPASIFYQSPWYQEYKRIEDHFARINTVLTKGKACVRTAVLHPMESYWLLRCSAAESMLQRKELDSHFAELAEWLLTGSVDFDYLAESFLEDMLAEGTCQVVEKDGVQEKESISEELGSKKSCCLQVGHMQYDVVILADCNTLRTSTTKILTEFKKKGGRLLFVGNTPYLSMGEPSKETEALHKDTLCIAHSRVQLYDALKDIRDVEISKAEGGLTYHYIYQLRQEAADKWLFVANIRKAELPHIATGEDVVITVNGNYRPELYDTQSGNVCPISYRNEKGKTKIFRRLYDNDSLLVHLRSTEEISAYEELQTVCFTKECPISSMCTFSLEEPNVLVLDMAQFSLDDGALQDEEEILRIDDKIRKQLGFTSRRTKFVQPWAIKDVPEDHKIKLIFRVRSQIICRNVMIGVERPEKMSMKWNGQAITSESCGFYVDKAIRTIPLPEVVCGENLLEITMPFGLRTDLENVYLLGNFGTAYTGRQAFLTKMPKTLYFGSVVHQGLAFYGGNIRYHTKVSLEKTSDVEFEISHYRGALIKVLIDGKESGCILYAPYRLKVLRLEAGIHEVTFILYGNRYNTFSALHTLVADQKRLFKGPDYWRSEKDRWAYEYQTRPMGILKTPVIYITE